MVGRDDVGTAEVVRVDAGVADGEVDDTTLGTVTTAAS